MGLSVHMLRMKPGPTSFAAPEGGHIAWDRDHVLADAARLHALAANPVVGVRQIGGLDDVLGHVLGEGHVGELHAPKHRSAPIAWLLLHPGRVGIEAAMQHCTQPKRDGPWCCTRIAAVCRQLSVHCNRHVACLSCAHELIDGDCRGLIHRPWCPHMSVLRCSMHSRRPCRGTPGLAICAASRRLLRAQATPFPRHRLPG